jgi:hypothetical protein
MLLRRWQRRCRLWGLLISRRLQRKTALVPPGRLKAYCIGLLLLSAGANGWMMIRALTHPVLSFKVEQIKMPAHVRDTVNIKSNQP